MNYAKTDDPKKARRFSTIEAAETRIKNIGIPESFETRIEPDPDGHGCFVIKAWPKGKKHYEIGRFWIQDKRQKIVCTTTVQEAATLAATVKIDA